MLSQSFSPTSSPHFAALVKEESLPTNLENDASDYSYNLEIAQNPTKARATGWGSKADARRPVDPPPVLKFEIRDGSGNRLTHESKNMFIAHATLLSIDGVLSNENTSEGVPTPSRLAGTTITSLTHVRNPLPGKFLFIFNDLSIRQEGKYRLKFRMYEVLSDQCMVKFRAEVASSIITAYSPKNFPGLGTSSDLIKEIAQQGHRVRVRKESTLNKRKKRPGFENMPGVLDSPTTSSKSFGSFDFQEFDRYDADQRSSEFRRYSSPQMDDMQKPGLPNPVHEGSESFSDNRSSKSALHSDDGTPVTDDYNRPHLYQDTSTEVKPADPGQGPNVIDTPVTQNNHDGYSNMIQISLIPIIPVPDGGPNVQQGQQPLQTISQTGEMNSDAYLFLNSKHVPQQNNYIP